MPDFPYPADGDVPLVGDSALDELLTAGQASLPAAPGLRPAAEVLAALRAAPERCELAGQARALAEYRRPAGRSRRGRHVLPGRGMLSRVRLSAKLAAAAAGAAAAAVGGTAAAAYADALPAPLQKVAHVAIAAPAASASPARDRPPAAVRPRGSLPGQAPGRARTRQGRAPGGPGRAGAWRGDREGRPGGWLARRGTRPGDPGRPVQPGVWASGPAARPGRPGRDAGHPAGTAPGRHHGRRPSRAGQSAAPHATKPTVHHQGKPAAVPTPQRSGIPGSARRH